MLTYTLLGLGLGAGEEQKFVTDFTPTFASIPLFSAFEIHNLVHRCPVVWRRRQY